MYTILVAGNNKTMYNKKNIFKLVLLILSILLVIFFVVEFLPGFSFSNNNEPKQTEQPASGIEKTTSPSIKTITSIPKVQTSTKDNDNQIKDIENQYTIKSVSLLGLDKAIESPHFTIYYHNVDEAKAKELLVISEKDYPALIKLFPQTPKTEILLTYDAKEYVNVFTAAPSWGADSNSSGGSFCPGCTKSLGKNTEYVYMFNPDNISFSHELAHRYYWASYPNLRKEDSFKWLNEGQAVFAQTEIAPGPGGLSSNLEKINDLPLPTNFLALNQLQQSGEDLSLERFYDLVGLMAYYINSKTSVGLYKFISDLNDTGNLDKTCQNIFGFDSNELMKRWAISVMETTALNSTNFLVNFKKIIYN